MTTIPAPTIVLSREEWPDADFDLPDGEPIHASDAESDKEDEEDWDLEMDFGNTGGAKAQVVIEGIAARSESFRRSPHMFTIRPPLATHPDEEEEDEGVSTIKLTALPKPTVVAPPATIDEDFEEAFVLPSDLTQLSLRPVSLIHRSSKSSLEWGDKDQTSSSQSSDAFSSLGFTDNSPSSNYTSASLPETESEDEDEDDRDLVDGLIIPTGLFESRQSAKKLAKILEEKKNTVFTDDRVKIVNPDPEDDFEIGLVIDNDIELSPSRLLQNTQTVKRPALSITRSKSAPPRPPAATRPPSHLKGGRAKSPHNPPISSAQQLRKLAAPPSPPPSRPSRPVRSQTYSQAVASSSSTMSFLTPKPGSLRVQKSHSGLKPASPPSTQRLGRKASLPSLSETNQTQASGSGSASGVAGGSQVGRYNAPTASSRAKNNSAGRIHGLEYNVPPARPSTPSSNTAALRLTMPTSSSRLKARPPISSVFPSSNNVASVSSMQRSASPLPPRPPSAPATRPRHTQTQSLPMPPTVKVLKKPKRQRTYGDGTELDGFDDLPLDREKEGRFRVQPVGYGSRLPSSSNAEGGSSGKGTLRRKGKRNFSGGSADSAKAAGSAKTLKRTGRIDFPAKPSEPSRPGVSKPFESELCVKKKKTGSSSTGNTTFRKPTLIRNLGGAGAAKVVGEMKWNPTSLRWEGNDQVLRDFDAATGTSTRVGLITHLTGSSIGSPVGSFAAGARVVGNMIFDPARMCWISTLPPEEDEPDVFADLADDEDDDWEARGSTIRASQQVQPSATPTITADSSCASLASRSEAPSPSGSHRHSMSESESDRGSRASIVCDVDDAFADKCREAERRHHQELKGWLSISRADALAELDRTYLYEIRALATRQY